LGCRSTVRGAPRAIRLDRAQASGHGYPHLCCRLSCAGVAGQGTARTCFERHECLSFVIQSLAVPFGWEFNRAGKVRGADVTGRLVFERSRDQHRRLCRRPRVSADFLVRIDGYWRSGRAGPNSYGLGGGALSALAYHPSRHLPPAKGPPLSSIFVVASISPTRRKGRHSSKANPEAGTRVKFWPRKSAPAFQACGKLLTRLKPAR